MSGAAGTGGPRRRAGEGDRLRPVKIALGAALVLLAGLGTFVMFGGFYPETVLFGPTEDRERRERPERLESLKRDKERPAALADDGPSPAREEAPAPQATPPRERPEPGAGREKEQAAGAPRRVVSRSLFARIGYGDDNRAGLRAAERLSATRLRLVLGPGVRPAVIPEKHAAFQVASAGDPDFRRGVRATSARVVKREPDGTYPARYAGPRFERFTVEVTLPDARPMKIGHRYWLRVNSNQVIATNPRARWIVAEGATPPADLEPRHGVREVRVVSPTVIRVSTGPGVDLERLYDAANVAVTSPDDPAFREPVHPAKVGRRSSLDFYVPDGWPWRFHGRHEVFLVLPQRITSGRTYVVDLNARDGSPVACGRSRIELAFDDDESVNLAIKVNQAGYLPGAKEKYAYLGMWMGELGACDFAPHAGAFEVVDANTREVVLRGTPSLRRKATYRLEGGKVVPDPAKVKGPETVYRTDLSYEDVYQIDISRLAAEGTYYVRIPGMGRSFAFRVSRDVYAGPFRIAMNGIYHQRCGVELGEPWSTHYRPACHRTSTEHSTFRKGVDKDPFRNLPKHATDGAKHDLRGGHHDAGDWNPRAHLEVAEALFLLYEMNPGAFRDGDLTIPESGNGVPDILDEAMWALDLWTRLQDEDGGVRGGIESAGDPREFDTAATDTLREFAFARDAAASYRFAAVAAQASIILKGIWKGLGREAEAADLLARAVRAWEWAEANGGGDEDDRHVFAAAMLLRATGEATYDAAFRRHSVYSKDPKSVPREWKKHDQVFGSYHYVKAAGGNATLKRAITASFEGFFKTWRRAAETTTYRYMRSPYAPNTWGTGGLPKWPLIPAMTMHLTRDRALADSCRRWITFTNEFSLGCHPMNLVFTAGLGQRYVTGAWHILMWNSPGGMIPGIQTEGPGGRFVAGERPGRGGMGKWPGMSFFPPGKWPDLYAYSERASPGMNEGVVVNQALTAFAYGLLVPDAPRDRD